MRAFFLPSLGKIKTLYTIFLEKAKYDKKVGQCCGAEVKTKTQSQKSTAVR